MCLIVFDYQPHDSTRLRLVANRDEFHDRPSAPLHAWDDHPGIVGGRDLQAGGTWLAVHRRGRFAALTNVRDPRLIMPVDTPSRGHLVHDALTCQHLPTWLDMLAEGRAIDYAGFNLLAGDGQDLWHLHRGRNSVHLERVTPGVHAVSNADLDTPWPKVERVRHGLAESLGNWHASGEGWREAALAMMQESQPVAPPERLPDTGIGLEMERRLSPPFIVGDTYGTRAMSWLEWRTNGTLTIGERRFGPNGIRLDEQQLTLALEA